MLRNAVERVRVSTTLFCLSAAPDYGLFDGLPKPEYVTPDNKAIS